MMSLGKRIRDIVLEALIAVLFVTAFAVYVIKTHDATKLRDWTPVIQGGNTVLVFGFLIRWFRYAWRRSAFWAVLTVLLLVHIAVYMLLLRRIPQFPLIYYAIQDVCELGVFERVLVRGISLGERVTG